MQARNPTIRSVWQNNVSLVQLLGLCPLLAVTTTLVNGLGLGLATCLVITLSNTLVSLLRPVIPAETRIAVFMVIIATLVTAIELLLNAYFYALFQSLGIFVPLIVSNCAILGRAEGFAYKNSVLPSFLDGLVTGLGFAAVLIAMGAIRELVGSGTLFADAHLIFGAGAENLQINLLGDAGGFRLSLIPPGAFICLGFLIASQRFIDGRREHKRRRLARQSLIAPG